MNIQDVPISAFCRKTNTEGKRGSEVFDALLKLLLIFLKLFKVADFCHSNDVSV